MKTEDWSIYSYFKNQLESAANRNADSKALHPLIEFKTVCKISASADTKPIKILMET